MEPGKGNGEDSTDTTGRGISMENLRLAEECLKILNEIKHLILEIKADIHNVNINDSLNK